MHTLRIYEQFPKRYSNRKHKKRWFVKRKRQNRNAKATNQKNRKLEKLIFLFLFCLRP
jgi:hypothetical protein